MSAGEFFFGLALAGGAHDEAAGDSGVMDLQDAFQPQAFVVARDFARHAHVIDRRHVDHVAARAARYGK